MRKQAGGNQSLMKKIIPDYKLGCKRILLTSEFIPMFNKPNCHLITDPISKISKNGIQTKKKEELAIVSITSKLQYTSVWPSQKTASDFY